MCAINAVIAAGILKPRYPILPPLRLRRCNHIKTPHRHTLYSTYYRKRFLSAAVNDTGILGLYARNPGHLDDLCNNALKKSKRILDEIFVNVSKRNDSGKYLLYSIDEISNLLCRIADPCELIRHVHPQEGWRTTANSIVERVSSFINNVNINEQLYELMKQYFAADDGKLDQEERHVFHHMIESMKYQGLGLPSALRDEYLNLQSEEGSIAFMLSDPGITKHATTTAFNGQAIPANPGLNTESEEGRRRLWEAQNKSDESALTKLLRLKEIRQRLATIRGFSCYASCAQRECMLQSPHQVKELLKHCSTIIRDDLMKELRQLETKKKTASYSGDLEPWDLDFLMTQDKGNIAVAVSIESVLSYFASLLNSLFGISLKIDRDEHMWHPLVAKLSLVGTLSDGNSGEQTLGHLYLDLFDRNNKVNVSAQFTVRCSKDLSIGKKLFGDSEQVYKPLLQSSMGRQIPATAIACNFPVPDSVVDAASAFKCGYIDIVAAQTLFHELGHTLHALLSETKLQHLSGNRGGVDFAEFSSHLFELYFAHGIEQICKFDNLPLQRINSGKAYLSAYKGIETARMILWAYLDQEFYSSGHLTINDESKYDIPIFNESYDQGDGKSLNRLLGIPAISNFDHLVHYGGTYFCYLYARILAAKMWSTFGSDPCSRKVGDRLRNFFKGGSVDASLNALNKLAGVELESLPCKLIVDV